MRLSTQVAHNTIIQLAGKIIATILGLFTIALMTRYLGTFGFGQYTTIMTFLSFFAVLADLGLTLVTTQMISQPQVEPDKILGNLFGLRFITALIFLGLAPLVVIFFPYQSIVKIGITITTLSFFFIALNQILVGLYQKNLKMQIVAGAEILSRLALLVGIIIIVIFKLGLLGIMTATIISSLVSFLIHYLYSFKLARLKLLFDWPVWREILKKSWPLALTIAFNLIYLRADTLILSLLKEQSTVGLYGASYKVVDILTTLPFMFAGLVLPLMTAAWATSNTQYFKKILQKSFDVMAIMALPLLIGTQFVAQPIMALVAGRDFSLAGNILQILILAVSFIFLGTIFSHAIIAIDQQKKIIKAYIFTALSSLVAYLIFIPPFSYYGAAWVTVYSEVVIAVASFYLIYKYSGFLPNLNIFFKSMLASLIMALAVYFIWPRLNLFITLAIAGLVYFVALYLTKAITKNDLLNLLDMEKINGS